MNQTDSRICREVIHTLKSAKYSSINYLFLEPVDVAFFPTYLSLVKKPMDLGTALKNLDAGIYSTKDEFFNDAALCFENAENFHKDKPENNWIIKMAKEMNKMMNKERKRTEKKLGGGGGAASSSRKPKLKISLNKKSDKKASLLKTVPNIKDNATPATSQPKVKLSLKIKSNSASSEGKKKIESVFSASGPVTAKSNAPTLKIPKANTPSLKIPKANNTPSLKIPKANTPSLKIPKASTPTLKTMQPVKPKKPKIKLKISKSLPTTKAATSDKTPTAASNVAKTTKKSEEKSKSKPKPKATSTPRSSASAPSRGKELPTAVAEAKASKKAEAKKASAAKKANAKAAAAAAVAVNIPAPKLPNIKLSAPKVSGTSTSQTKAKAKSKSKPKLVLPPSKRIKISHTGLNRIDVGDGSMTPNVKAQCYKVISGLKRKEYVEIRWFLKPVNDPTVIDDYRAKIKNPVDIGTLSSNLEKGAYPNVSAFIVDLRRIFGNCLRFNALDGDSFRPVAVSMASTTENLMHLFLQSHSSKEIYPKLLYCWKSCVEVLDKALTLKNPEDNYPTAHYFLHPVSFYFGGHLPPDYLDKVPMPIDFGTITSKLFDGTYQTVKEFVSDCRLVTANCKSFYGDNPEGKLFILQATRLEQYLMPLIDGLVRYDTSQQGINAKKAFHSPLIEVPLKPPKAFKQNLLKFLREATYTDRASKVVELASALFEHPVDTNMFADYLQYVKTPMCLKTVEKKIESGLYVYAEDFEHDINLIFRNCEAYNVPKRNQRICNLAKYCAKIFRKQYSTRIRAFDAEKDMVPSAVDHISKKRPSPKNVPEPAAPPAKKSRKSPANFGGANKIPIPVNAKTKPPKKTLPRITIRTDGPLPRHVAVAKIKQEFSTRRPHKNLELPWEAACSRLFRELKRHPWISTSKRFVFDAPVPLLHPEIKEAYALKVRQPMDLTTAECKLLQGGIYEGPQEFVDDIARVFANAVAFNKSGHEQGDPTSCAYFDASRHLLRYTRWLSLETLSSFLWDDSHSEGAKLVGPVPQWALSLSNRKDAQKEMDAIVMNQSIDKSDEGDRFTWMESECDKLLKSLRHQSDIKRMCFFLQPNFPGDYFAYISKPMDWETCHRRLQDRKYDTFGQIVEDLRQIFSNALKYNGRMKDKDPASKFAYDSAITMSEKLEVAIQRMLVTVSDRAERDKVEQVVLDREQEIAQKEEDERVRKEWEQERKKSASGESNQHKVSSSTMKSVRRPHARGLDFDFPFYEEENDHEQSVMEVLSQQKVLFEEQRRDRVRMDQVTKHIGYRVHHNIQERSCAIRWAKQLTERIEMTISQKQLSNKGTGNEKGNDKDSLEKQNLGSASFIASLMQKSERSQVKLSLPGGKRNRKKKKRATRRLFLD